MTEMEEICERYKNLYGGVIYDVLDHLGFPDQVLSHQLVPLKDEIKLAGPAFTV
jgi:4-hydroxy-4-methyl-2-oxoglutarate aldolase